MIFHLFWWHFQLVFWVFCWENCHQFWWFFYRNLCWFTLICTFLVNDFSPIIWGTFSMNKISPILVIFFRNIYWLTKIFNLFGERIFTNFLWHFQLVEILSFFVWWVNFLWFSLQISCHSIIIASKLGIHSSFQLFHPLLSCPINLI